MTFNNSFKKLIIIYLASLLSTKGFQPYVVELWKLYRLVHLFTVVARRFPRALLLELKAKASSKAWDRTMRMELLCMLAVWMPPYLGAIETERS